MQEREKANEMIAEIDSKGIIERKNEKEFFQVKKVNEDEYIVRIIDSDVVQDNHKTYSHTREGLEEFITAYLNNPHSILHRL